MFSHLPKDASTIWKRIRRNYIKHYKSNSLNKFNSVFGNGVYAKNLLAPSWECHRYYQSVRMLSDFGLVVYYLRGGFSLTTMGVDVINHPIRSFFLDYRKEIIIPIVVTLITEYLTHTLPHVLPTLLQLMKSLLQVC